MNLRKMRNEREVVYEVRREGGRPTKMYKLSDHGLVRASVSGLSKGMTGQISSVLEKLSHSNPARIKGWLRGRKKLHLEIDQPGLGKVKVTLHPRAASGRK